jgi:8-hydroxy-5-deazaflavin:NADPH oxidoreductase
MSRRVLIIGAGNVGSALGHGWLKSGHDVRFGVSDPTSNKYAAVPKNRLQPADDRRGAEVVVLATPYAVVKEAVAALGDLTGTILIDCTNPIAMGPDGLHLVIGHGSSGAEEIAKAALSASVFKTLNQTGAENMAEAAAYHPKPMMFVAGDDAANKPTVMELVSDLGFQAVDAGPLSAARLLEPLAMLWIELATKRGHARDFAFAMVRHSRSSQT